MYATPGTHAYILPWGLLHDETDRGPLWDPSLNFFSYTYELPKKPFDDPDEPSVISNNIIPSALPSDLAHPAGLGSELQGNNTSKIKRPILRASSLTPKAPLEWFLFAGHWGDKIYPLSDDRQYRFAGQYHYVTGPIGPWAKNLGRKTVCQGPGRCIIRHWGDGGIAGSKVKVLTSWDEFGEDGEGKLGDVEWDRIAVPRPAEPSGNLHD